MANRMIRTTADPGLDRARQRGVGVQSASVSASGAELDGLDALKERQLLFRWVRDLDRAQFALGDTARSSRLWQEAALMGFDPERLTRLLYGGQDPHDTAALEAIDRVWRQEQRQQHGWRRPAWWPGALRQPSAWHRSAPGAAAPTHRSGR